MKTAHFRTLGIAALLITAAGCGTNNQVDCTSDRECQISGQPNLFCITGHCIYVGQNVDMAADLTPIDLEVSKPDFSFQPDMLNGCPFGTKQCGVIQGNVPRCIPNSYCCNNNDCTAVGQTCNNDGKCLCPVGFKACLSTCIANANCCTNDDCPSKLCLVNGTCAVPGCSDGVVNGNETDIDCGGGFCSKCQIGRSCSINLDCRSNACVSMKCSEPGFSAASYGGANGPTFIVSDDFNGDKKPDLATSNLTSNNVSVVLGNGIGGYVPTGSFSAGVSPVFLTSGDLNGDQRADLVVVNSVSYDVTVLLGYGDGTFAPGVAYGVGANPRWATIADVNGDNRKDIVVANQVSNSISVLLGKGDGKFQNKSDFITDTSPRAVVAGDFNSDGLNDVAVACTGKLSILINKTAAGLVGFATTATTPTAITNAPMSMTMADFNGDKKLDLVIGASGQGGQVFTGGGNGGFLLAGAIGAGNFFAQMIPIDINGDKVLDLATTNGTLLGNGNGSFQAILNYPGFTNLASIAVADFTLDNKDGKLDIAFPQQFANNIITLFGNGDGTYQALNAKLGMVSGTTTDITLIQPRFVKLFDINGDNRADLLTSSISNNTVWVQLANANGSLQLPSVYPSLTQPFGIDVADLNEDKNPDVIVANASGSPTILSGSANGQLTPVVPVMGVPPAIGAPNATNVAAADFDKDGHIDLFFSDLTGGKILLNSGKGDWTFSNNAKPIALMSTATARTIQVVDFDGDGYLDLITSNGSATSIAINKGPDMMGVYQGFNQTLVVQAMGVRSAGAYAADLNNDQQTDLVVADNAVPGVKVFINANLGQGQIAFNAPVNYGIAAQPICMTMADINNDKFIDIITVNNLDRSVSTLLGTGKGTFNGLINHDVGVNPVYITSGDVNGDGKPDFATANQAGANTMTVLLNTL